MNRYAGNKFSSFHDIKKMQSLYHDYSNEENIKKGFNLPLFSADKAAEILINESQKHDLILYEYFLTDFAGHAQNFQRSIDEIRKVEKVIIALLNRINLNSTILIVVSDHGNIEDISTKSHTTNPAFLGIWDQIPLDKSHKFNSLQDLFPYIYLKVTGELPDKI
jgi:bisphosphoglycerate-independent phosphoglycerate mutase (AlkP superfamily)